MKVVLKSIFVFLIFTTSICCADTPRLILYFDINKTLIASDKATNKSVENILNELLAKKYGFMWDDNDERAHDFVNFLTEQIHPLLPFIIQDYLTALMILDRSERMIFPSFYDLLNYLDNENIPYSIVLRSFGFEVMDVKEEIEKFHPFVFETGRFHQGTLILESGEAFSEPEEIYQRLKIADHAAIQDDWSYWNTHHGASAQSKPFYINPEDPEIFPIFFDDNIKTTQSLKNIIAPINVLTGELIPIEELVEKGQAVRIDTLEAILNPNYFIDLVKDALKQKDACYQD